MDKNDVFWCLSTEGLSSLASSHSGIVFSPIENGIAKLIVGKIVGLAKKGECRECIDFISENKINKKESVFINSKKASKNVSKYNTLPSIILFFY